MEAKVPERSGQIYALLDPRTSAIRYVGQTVNPLTYRLRQHISRAHLRDRHVRVWINSLTEIGLQPLVTALASVPVDDLDDQERRWIKELRSQGCDLTNLTEGGSGVGKGELNPQAKLTEAQVVLLRERSAAGVTYAELAKEFGLVAVSCVIKGRSWKFAGGPIQPGRKTFTNKGRIHTETSKKNMQTAQQRLSPFTEEQVFYLRKQFAKGVSIKKLAHELNVSPSGVHQVVTGKTWKNLPLTPREVTREEVEIDRQQKVRASRSKLTDEKVMHLRWRYANEDITVKELGIQEEVHRATLGQILSGNSWTHLPVLETRNSRARGRYKKPEEMV